MAAMNMTTGDFRMVDFTSTDQPPVTTAGEVLVHGTEDEIRRLSKAVRTLSADEQRKAKRKAQRQARKQNR